MARSRLAAQSGGKGEPRTARGARPGPPRGAAALLHEMDQGPQRKPLEHTRAQAREGKLSARWGYPGVEEADGRAAKGRQKTRKGGETGRHQGRREEHSERRSPQRSADGEDRIPAPAHEPAQRGDRHRAPGRPSAGERPGDKQPDGSLQATHPRAGEDDARGPAAGAWRRGRRRHDPADGTEPETIHGDERGILADPGRHRAGRERRLAHRTPHDRARQPPRQGARHENQPRARGTRRKPAGICTTARRRRRRHQEHAGPPWGAPRQVLAQAVEVLVHESRGHDGHERAVGGEADQLVQGAHDAAVDQRAADSPRDRRPSRPDTEGGTERAACAEGVRAGRREAVDDDGAGGRTLHLRLAADESRDRAQPPAR